MNSSSTPPVLPIPVQAVDLSEEERRVLQKLVRSKGKPPPSAGHGMGSSEAPSSELEVWTIDKLWQQVCNKLHAKLVQSEQTNAHLEKECAGFREQTQRSRDQADIVKQNLMNLCRLWESKQAEARAQIVELTQQCRLLRETEVKLETANATIQEMQTRSEKQLQTIRRLKKEDTKDKRNEKRLAELRKKLDERDRVLAELQAKEGKQITPPSPSPTPQMERLRRDLVQERAASAQTDLKVQGLTQEVQSQLEYIQRLEAEKLQWKPMLDMWRLHAAQQAAYWHAHTPPTLVPAAPVLPVPPPVMVMSVTGPTGP